MNMSDYVKVSDLTGFDIFLSVRNGEYIAITNACERIPCKIDNDGFITWIHRGYKNKLSQPSDMGLLEYQKVARQYWEELDTISALDYFTMGVTAEAGEFANIVKHAHHHRKGVLDNHSWSRAILELGDILWFVSNAATELGVTLGMVAALNIDKQINR